MTSTDKDTKDRSRRQEVRAGETQDKTVQATESSQATKTKRTQETNKTYCSIQLHLRYFYLVEWHGSGGAHTVAPTYQSLRTGVFLTTAPLFPFFVVSTSVHVKRNDSK